MASHSNIRMIPPLHGARKTRGATKVHKTGCLIVLLLRFDSVEPNCPRTCMQQSVLPQSVPNATPTIFRANNIETQKREIGRVIDDRNRSNGNICVIDRNEKTVSIRCVKRFGILKSRVPAFIGSPV